MRAEVKVRGLKARASQDMTRHVNLLACTMNASLQSSQRRSVLAMDMASLDTRLVTAKDDNKLYGLDYHNASGMAWACLQAAACISV